MQMKKQILLLLLLTGTEVALSQKTSSVYVLSKDESQLVWKATYVLGGGHEGTLQFTSGKVTTTDNPVGITGEFITNINSIENTDIQPKEDGDGLEEHLRSDDFFSATRFPQGYFVLQKAESSGMPNQFTITGLLTLKGNTLPIQFPATIMTSKDVMKVLADITLDRTKWAINYNSKSIFADLKDGVISDDIQLTLQLTLRKGNALSR
jgi:polyisoprenoid-binding protein YceI